MEKQGMSEKETLEKLYDAGYTNALMQLRVHINAFIDKPNSQIKRVFELMDTMLEVNEEEKGIK
jgi:hypothetical protein